MNIKLISRALVLGAVIFSTQIDLSAQSKEAIILINSVPYNVTLSATGEITEIKGEAKKHMRGYKKSKEEFPTPAPADDIAVETIDLKGTSVRKERTMLSFTSGGYDFSTKLTKELDAVVSGFSKGSDEKILITGFKGDISEGDKLVQERIDKVKTYLTLKGISESSISSEIGASASLKDKLSITYIK